MSQTIDFKNSAFRAKFFMHNEFFCRTMSAFGDKDLDFCPAPGMLSVKGQVLHVVGSIELFVSAFLSGIEPVSKLQHTSFRPFQSWSGDSLPVTDLAWTERADRTTYDGQLNLSELMGIFSDTMAYVSDLFAMPSIQKLEMPIGKNSLVPEDFNVHGVLDMMFDHTAHHRGALAQYARLLGYSPKIPYFDMEEALHEEQIELGLET